MTTSVMLSPLSSHSSRKANPMKYVLLFLAFFATSAFAAVLGPDNVQHQPQLGQCDAGPAAGSGARPVHQRRCLQPHRQRHPRCCCLVRCRWSGCRPRWCRPSCLWRLQLKCRLQHHLAQKHPGGLQRQRLSYCALHGIFHSRWCWCRVRFQLLARAGQTTSAASAKPVAASVDSAKPTMP